MTELVSQFRIPVDVDRKNGAFVKAEKRNKNAGIFACLEPEECSRCLTAGLLL